MGIQAAIIMFDALSQETRLSIFRMLVEAGVADLPAGEDKKKDCSIIELANCCK